MECSITWLREHTLKADYLHANHCLVLLDLHNREIVGIVVKIHIQFLIRLLFYLYRIDSWVLIPDSSAGEESAYNTGVLGLISGLGRSSGEGNSYPLQDSGLDNSMDYSPWLTKSQTRPSNFHFLFLFPFFSICMFCSQSSIASLLNCGVGEDSWSPLDSKKIKPVNPKGSQSWILIGRTDAEVETPTLWPPDVKNWLIGKDPDGWERLKAGEGDDRGRGGWMASLTQWTWVWACSRSWWWTGKPDMLQPMWLQRVGHDWVIELTDWNLYMKFYQCNSFRVFSLFCLMMYWIFTC